MTVLLASLHGSWTPTRLTGHWWFVCFGYYYYFDTLGSEDQKG